MPVPSAARDFRDLVIRLQRKMEFFDDLQSSCCGVSFAQCHALAAIRRAGKISLNDLAAGMGLDKSTVSRTVDNLVKAEMALRDPVPADRRCVTIRLTAKGIGAIRGIEAGLSQCFESLYKSIDTSKRAPMMDSLRILLEAIEQMACGRQGS
ncbi:MAG: MarR family winged helix-turn-helix transcriptional regulator [Candidatus Aminicenantales bacterium]|jgi:DNA-binding MarR family transcriptional regulator